MSTADTTNHDVMAGTHDAEERGGGEAHPATAREDEPVIDRTVSVPVASGRHHLRETSVRRPLQTASPMG